MSRDSRITQINMTIAAYHRQAHQSFIGPSQFGYKNIVVLG